MDVVEMAADHGMCVAKPYDFVVWKDIFLKVRLPRQAVLGTKLPFILNCYNYAIMILKDRVSQAPKGVNKVIIFHPFLI